MNKLQKEITRLYLLNPLPGQLGPEALSQALLPASPTQLSDAQGQVRAMVLSLGHHRAWACVAAIYEGVQADFDFPAPGVAISPQTGYQIWFSLSEAIATAEAAHFLAAVQQKYLPDFPPAKVVRCPDNTRLNTAIVLAPSLDESTGKWSAFIDPSMGDLFADEPGLDFAPNGDRQADMLAALATITPEKFRQAVQQLSEQSRAEDEKKTAPLATTPESLQTPVGGPFTHPREFLLATMNDPQANLHDRIEAAKALLPYFAPDTMH